MAFPNKLAFQIQDFYKEETLQIVEQQPTDWWKISKAWAFKIADQLAEEWVLQWRPERFRAGLIHSL